MINDILRLAWHEAAHMIVHAHFGAHTDAELHIGFTDAGEFYCNGGWASEWADRNGCDVLHPSERRLSAIAGGVGRALAEDLPITAAMVRTDMSDGDTENAGAFSQADCDEVLAILLQHRDVFEEYALLLVEKFHACGEPADIGRELEETE